MSESQLGNLWWTCAAIRISHPTLIPNAISDILRSSPDIALKPGESKVPHRECRSAGYWAKEFRVDDPLKPDHAFLLVETYFAERKQAIEYLITSGCQINVYIAIFSNILTLGFDLPKTPTLWELGINIGVEYFSK